MKHLFFIIAIVFFYSCSSKKEAATESSTQTESSTMVTLTDVQIKNAGIETSTPQLRPMQATLKVNGVTDVAPQSKVSISFPYGGYLKSTRLLPGMKVYKGQPIAQMQDASFIQLQQDYLEAKTKLAFLEKEYERQRLLNSTKAASDKVFEQTASDFQSEKIRSKALREKLLLLGISPERLTENSISRTVNIYSPINGYVSVVNVNTGQYVNPADVLFELINPNDLHLAITVFEKDIAYIQPGQKLVATLVNDTGKIYPAQVLLVNKLVDNDRSAQVHCHFTTPTPRLLPGMFMNAIIQLNNRNEIVVPQDAVVQSGNQQYIFLAHDKNHFEITPITTGVIEDGLVAINTADTSLLRRTIISKNAYAALMKMKNTGEEE